MNKTIIKPKYSVLAISGAIQEKSQVTKILQKAATLDHLLNIQVVKLNDIPLLNNDLFQQNFPPSIQQLRTKASQADALLLSSYLWLGKISPALKNSIDWLTYSPNKDFPSPIRNMPAAMITFGADQESSKQGQKYLLQISHFGRLKIMCKPVLHYKFSEDQIFSQKQISESAGQVEQLKEYLDYLWEFIDKRKKAPIAESSP